MEYVRATIKEKYLIAALSPNMEEGRTEMRIAVVGREAIDDAPIDYRMAMLISLMAVGNLVNQDLSDSGFDFQGIDLKLIDKTLSYIQSVWPYDYALAKKQISNSSSFHMLERLSPSDCNFAFAPEGSVGFMRILNHESPIGIRMDPELNPMEMLKALFSGKDLEDIMPKKPKTITKELEFPVHIKKYAKDSSN